MDILTGITATNFRNDAGKLSILLGVHKSMAIFFLITRGIGRWKAAKRWEHCTEKNGENGKKQAGVKGLQGGEKQGKTWGSIVGKWL